jgi:hypothetical protein
LDRRWQYPVQGKLEPPLAGKIHVKMVSEVAFMLRQLSNYQPQLLSKLPHVNIAYHICKQAAALKRSRKGKKEKKGPSSW